MTYARSISKHSALAAMLMVASGVTLASQMGGGSGSGSGSGGDDTCIAQDARDAMHDAQLEVLDDVISSVPSSNTDLSGCVGDYGVDVSIMTNNWLQSFLDKLLGDFCDADFSLDDLDTSGGDDPYEPPEDYGWPMLGEIVPESFYVELMMFYEEQGNNTKYLPWDDIVESADYITSSIVVQQGPRGRALLGHHLQELQAKIDAIDCEQYESKQMITTNGIVHQITNRREVVRCYKSHDYFNQRRLSLLSITDAALQAWEDENGNPADED